MRALLPPIIVTVVVFLLWTTSAMGEVPISKPNCPEKCGNIIIPYPFGIGSKCSANSYFLITCSNSTTPFLPSIKREVIDISIEGTVTVKYPVKPMNCTNVQETTSIGISFLGSPYTISPYSNSFAVLGCKNYVLLPEMAYTVVRGCSPMCLGKPPCHGVNCCRINVPPLMKELNYSYQTIQQNNTPGFCGYAFLVDDSWFYKDVLQYKGLRNDSSFDENLKQVPLVLDWELLPKNVSSYANCEEQFSSILRCSCMPGFGGNPYIDGGCVDIDECKDALHYVCKGSCINTNGSFVCQANNSHGSGTTHVRNIALISIGATLGAGILLLALTWAWKLLKIVMKRFNSRKRRRLFMRNGGLLLEQKLSSTENGYKKSKLFTSKELARATDYYNEDRILGQGGQGTVYKGMLTDGRIVAVKKSKKVREDDVEVFINEVLILSQINHRNIVKLLGCCLETEIPLLVYEFVPNGTLFQHIHAPSEDFALTWQARLRIAAEIAGAIAYLHSSASAPIFHRDVKSTNVLLDERYRAKISDFGTSKSVAADQTHLTTRVLGTFGYLDPEYFQSNRFTEKSDVYSFGVVMVELLTGERAVSTVRAEAGRSLAAYFLQKMEEDELFEMVDERMLSEGGGVREEVVAVAEISKRCLHLNGKLRPAMKQVSHELESIIQIKNSRTSSEFEASHSHDSAVEQMEPSYDCSSSVLSITLER